MKGEVIGRAYFVGKDVDTDVIIPARYLTTMDPEILKEHLFEDLPYAPKPEEGMNIIVAGKNFGCGSSREHAPIAIGAAGFEAVIAPSFSRIFWRNAINGAAVLPIHCTNKAFYAQVISGDTLKIDVPNGRIYLPNGEVHGFLKFSGIEREIAKAGGLTAYNKGKMGLA